MSDPVSFVIRDHGRIEAMLGGRLVGYAQEHPQIYRCALGEIGAYYHILLPVMTSATRPASTLKAARLHLLQWIAGWFTDAGPHFAAIAETIMVQALREGSDDEYRKAPTQNAGTPASLEF